MTYVIDQNNGDTNHPAYKKYEFDYTIINGSAPEKLEQTSLSEETSLIIKGVVIGATIATLTTISPINNVTNKIIKDNKDNKIHESENISSSEGNIYGSMKSATFEYHNSTHIPTYKFEGKILSISEVNSKTPQEVNDMGQEKVLKQRNKLENAGIATGLSGFIILSIFSMITPSLPFTAIAPSGFMLLSLSGFMVLRRKLRGEQDV